MILAIAFLLGAGLDFKSLYERGQLLYSRGEWEEARQTLVKATAANPKSFDARFLLGATLVQLNRTRDAVGELRIACGLNPAHRDAAKLLAIQYGASDNHPEAVKLLAPLVDAPPLDEEVHLLLIEAYQESGQGDRALQLAEKAMRRFPRSAAAHYWMGLELRDAARFAEAKQFLDSAVRLDPGYQQAYVAEGDLALKQQQYEEAAKYFRTALSQKPDDAAAYIGMSRALAGQNQTPAAIQVLERAAELTADPKIHLELSQLYRRSGDNRRAAEEADLFRRKKAEMRAQ